MDVLSDERWGNLAGLLSSMTCIQPDAQLSLHKV